MKVDGTIRARLDTGEIVNGKHFTDLQEEEFFKEDLLDAGETGIFISSLEEGNLEYINLFNGDYWFYLYKNIHIIEGTGEFDDGGF